MSLLSKVGQLARDEIRALLGISTYEQARPGYGTPPEVEEQIRTALGGNITPMPVTPSRWYLADLEQAMDAADTGDLQRVGELCRMLRRDGMISGLLATRTDGLVRLPLRFYGDEEQIGQLKARNGTRSLFAEMFPPSEIALLAADGILAGVGFGELLPVQGRDYPVFCRLDPTFLTYRWNEGRWYMRSVVGLLPITPGDGRWILHTPCGRIAPWQHSTWRALGRAFISKEHAWLHRQNFSAKLANPARVGVTPLGATDPQKESLLAKLIAWGLNTTMVIPPGYDVKLVESNGRGADVFGEDIATADQEIMITLAGQVVTTTGGVGFANTDMFRMIKSDLIEATGDGLAHTINTQGLPPWIVQRWGIDALTSRATVEWDTSQPKDLTAEATALVQVATAINELRKSLAKYGRQVDVTEMCNRFSVPLRVVQAANDAPESGIRSASDAALDIDPKSLETLVGLLRNVKLQPTRESMTAVAESIGIRVEPASDPIPELQEAA